MWTAHQMWMGHPVCCPAECVTCPDDWPPHGTYELGLWPKYAPGSTKLLPVLPDLANLCCPIGDRCPPSMVMGSDHRCYPPELKDCFYSDYGEPAPPCPPGTYEYGQPDWSNDNVRLCCPNKLAQFDPG